MRNDPIDLQDDELDSFRKGQLSRRGESQKVLGASGKVKAGRRDDERGLLGQDDDRSMEFDKGDYLDDDELAKGMRN